MEARRLLTTILVCVLSAYLAALAYLAINQRRIVFHPDTSPVALSDEAIALGFSEVQLTSSDGLGLTAWHFPAKSGHKTIVYFHGNAGNLGDRIERVRPYVRSGYGVFLVGYRGYGGNPGQPSETGLYADGRAHLAWLNNKGIRDRDIVYFGESLGGAVALQLAIEKPPAGLILEAPFASILASARARFPLFAFSWLIRDKFANVEKISSLRAPLLVIHGERDGVTAFRFGQQVFAAAPDPKFALWVAEAGHGDLTAHGMPERVLEFLDWIAKAQSRSGSNQD